MGKPAFDIRCICKSMLQNLEMTIMQDLVIVWFVTCVVPMETDSTPRVCLKIS